MCDELTVCLSQELPMQEKRLPLLPPGCSPGGGSPRATVRGFFFSSHLPTRGSPSGPPELLSRNILGSVCLSRAPEFAGRLGEGPDSTVSTGTPGEQCRDWAVHRSSELCSFHSLEAVTHLPLCRPPGCPSTPEPRRRSRETPVRTVPQPHCQAFLNLCTDTLGAGSPG